MARINTIFGCMMCRPKKGTCFPGLWPVMYFNWLYVSSILATKTPLKLSMLALNYSWELYISVAQGHMIGLVILFASGCWTHLTARAPYISNFLWGGGGGSGPPIHHSWNYTNTKYIPAYNFQRACCLYQLGSKLSKIHCIFIWLIIIPVT